jgi:hypothetical protein
MQRDSGAPAGTRDLITAEAERTGARIDANTLFGKLVNRYRGLSFYQDSVKLAHRTVNESDAGAKPLVERQEAATRSERTQANTPRTSREQSLDCKVNGTFLDVVSSVIGSGASCDARDTSPIGKLALARQMWTLPHLALRFADEPLLSMRAGDCGPLIPILVEEVTIDARPMLKLHLQSEKAGPANGEERCHESTVDLFVNPTSMLVERIEQAHGLGDGVRYEATLEITPSRAVEEVPSQPPTQPPSQPLNQPPLGAPLEERVSDPVAAPTAAPVGTPAGAPIGTPDPESRRHS